MRVLASPSLAVCTQQPKIHWIDFHEILHCETWVQLSIHSIFWGANQTEIMDTLYKDLCAFLPAGPTCILQVETARRGIYSQLRNHTWGILHDNVIIQPGRHQTICPYKDHWPQTAKMSSMPLANIKGINYGECARIVMQCTHFLISRMVLRETVCLIAHLLTDPQRTFG